MAQRAFPGFAKCLSTGRLILCLGVPGLFPVAGQAAGLIQNPTFADADGDGKPDGWELKTYVLEDFRGIKCLSMKVPRKDKSSFTGEATTVFLGSAGYYQVTVSYLDEKDGISKAKLLVNDRLVHIWNFDGTFGDCWRDEVIENVELKPGDRITFRGRDNPTEYCRVRSLTVVPSPRPPSPAEIEERRSPPAIADVTFGPLVALRDVRDLSADEHRPDSRPLILAGPVLFAANGREPVDFELTLNQPRAPTYSLAYHGPESTGRGKGETIVKDSELSYDPGTGVATIRVPAGRPGLHELRAWQAYWSADVPHVLAVGAGPKDATVAHGTGLFYFFVPKGTPAFGVGAYCNGGYIAEVTIRAPDGSLVTRMDVPNDAPQGIPVRVRAGQDDRVWSVSVSGVSPKLRLCGVPPYVAAHPRYLMVPKECVTQAKP